MELWIDTLDQIVLLGFKIVLRHESGIKNSQIAELIPLLNQGQGAEREKLCFVSRSRNNLLAISFFFLVVLAHARRTMAILGESSTTTTGHF